MTNDYLHKESDSPTDGHMALLDETGGKPLTGYGSGANSGAPASDGLPGQAATLEAQA